RPGLLEARAAAARGGGFPAPSLASKGAENPPPHGGRATGRGGCAAAPSPGGARPEQRRGDRGERHPVPRGGRRGGPPARTGEAGFFQSGETMELHFIAPQFLAWFYPANSELFHALGMLAFGRDLLSPLLNIGWFAGCLLAAWCIGRPYRVAPWSLILGAVALSVPALADQAGEARNDIVGIFFLLAAVAVALNAWGGAGSGDRPGGAGSVGALAVAGLAVGLAAGTKLNFLLPAVILMLGLALAAPRGRRWRAL